MPGIRNIKYGILWFIGGLIITIGTYILAPGGYYIITFGAIIIGIIQFVIGVAQYLRYKARGSESKAQVHAEATVKVILQCMLATTIADGVILDEEVQTIAKIYEKFFGYQIDPELIRVSARKMIVNEFNIEHSLLTNMR